MESSSLFVVLDWKYLVNRGSTRPYLKLKWPPYWGVHDIARQKCWGSLLLFWEITSHERKLKAIILLACINFKIWYAAPWILSFGSLRHVVEFAPRLTSEAGLSSGELLLLLPGSQPKSWRCPIQKWNNIMFGKRSSLRYITLILLNPGCTELVMMRTYSCINIRTVLIIQQQGIQAILSNWMNSHLQQPIQFAALLSCWTRVKSVEHAWFRSYGL